MECGDPPALTEDQISAAIDGNADSNTLQHLEQCASCARRVEQARQIEMLLRQRLFRWTCPPVRALRDFHFGLLNAEQTNTVVDHLTTCPQCQAELDELRGFLADEPLAKTQQGPKSIFPKLPLGDFIARFVPQLSMDTQIGLQPALRGSVSEPLMFEAGETTIFLELESTPAGHALRGQVVASPENQPAWTNALVELWHVGELQLAESVDEFGGFRCPLLTQGQFELRITSSGGQRLLIRNIEFEE